MRTKRQKSRKGKVKLISGCPGSVISKHYFDQSDLLIARASPSVLFWVQGYHHAMRLTGYTPQLRSRILAIHNFLDPFCPIQPLVKSLLHFGTIPGLQD